jgi:hypothetical protein
MSRWLGALNPGVEMQEVRMHTDLNATMMMVMMLMVMMLMGETCVCVEGNEHND